MKVSSQGKLAKIVFGILLVLFVVSLLLLPFGLQFLTMPEQVFVLTLLALLVIYSKVFGSYYFVSVLLSLIDKGEDVYNHISGKLSKKSLYDYLLEGDLLVLAETQLIKASEIASRVFDISLIFALGLVIVYLGGGLDVNALYAALLALMIVWVLTFFIQMYVELKFARVFEEELKELPKILSELNLQNQLEETQENDAENQSSDSENEVEKK